MKPTSGFTDFAIAIDAQLAALQAQLDTQVNAVNAVQARLDTQYTALEAVNKRITAIETPPPVIPVITDSAEFVAAYALWKANMLTYGVPLVDRIDMDLDATYYDGLWVYIQIMQFTNDAQWEVAVQKSFASYHKYIDPNNGNIQAIWMFPHGLEHYGDLETVKLLANHAAFAPEYPLSWTASANASREVAYNVMTKLVAVAAGGTPWGLDEQAVQVFDHFRQWTQTLNGLAVTGMPTNQPIPTYCRPFMAALSSYALIEWAAVNPTARLSPVLDVLVPFWNLLWTKCCLTNTMMYTNVEASDGSGGMQPSPDLNLMIAPVLAWLYRQTKDLAWREKHDILFIGGTQGAYLLGAKQFNQSYQRSFQGLVWRG